MGNPASQLDVRISYLALSMLCRRSKALGAKDEGPSLPCNLRYTYVCKHVCVCAGYAFATQHQALKKAWVGMLCTGTALLP